MLKKQLLGLLFLILSTSGYANNWKQIKDQDGIKIYTRSISTSNIKQFKATITLNTSLATLLAVLDDEKNYPTWVYECSEARIIEDSNFAHRVSYEKMNLPFPVSDRIVITQSVMQQIPAKKTFILTMKAAPTYCQNKQSEICKRINQSSAIMVPKADGVYTLTSINNDKAVNVIWIQHAETGGIIPKWLINAFISDVPYHSFQSLRKMVKKPEYSKAKFTYNQAGMVTGFVPATILW